MKQRAKALNTLLNSARRGSGDIRRILTRTMSTEMRSVLLARLREYEALAGEAYTVASHRSWELSEELWHTRHLYISGTVTDSRIAEKLILSRTRALISLLRCVHGPVSKDARLELLCQKQLDCERWTISQLQKFL